MNAPERILVTGEWVVPVATEPIPKGGVLVAGGSVEAVGPATDLRAAAPDAAEDPFLGGILVPGLVNAHAHLSLTVLEGQTPPAPFHDWLGDVVPRIAAMDEAELAHSAWSGVMRQFESGITAVGDITYRDETVVFAENEGLAGVFFREVLGMSGEKVGSHLESTGFPPTISGKRVHPGLAPHSAYSLGPSGILETVRRARESGMPFMMHVSESPAEVEALRRGEGPLARLASRQAPDLVCPETSTVAYLDGLGALDGLIAVHAVQADASDAALLAEKAAGVVLCPRSNLYLDCGVPPVRMLADAGVRLAVGTDSLASNRDFDLFAEGRALLETDPSLGHQRVLEIMTSEGASVLGLSGHGTLGPGSPADLVALSLGATDEPVRDVVGSARRRDIAAVMSAGQWRWRKGGS